MADFTSRFNELLERYSGSDSELAEILGVSKQAISAWKNGVRSPKRPTIRIIADYFGVGVPWLNGISDNETETGYEMIQRGFGPDTRSTQMLRKIGEQMAPYSSGYYTNRDELLNIYDRLNERGQADLLKYARYLNADPDMTEDGTSSSTTA